jgi:uncharacterized protein YbjT (DUF2867 family)
MSIVVTTPTGNVGSRVTQLLIQAGVRPTLIARNPDRLSPEVRAASDVRQGDLNDISFLARATEGAEALFLVIPADYTSEDPIGDMVRIGQNAADAVKRNRIGHVVFLSSAGADRPDIGFIEGLGRVEKLLNETDASVVYLRPGYFFTNLLMSLEQLKQGIFTTTVPLDIPMPWNDPRDIGDVAAVRLLSRAWSGQIVQPINGPENLTFAEVAKIAGEAMGRPVQAMQVTEEDARQAMQGTGMSAAAVEAFLAMDRGVSSGMEADYGRALQSATPTPLSAWCYSTLYPAASE